MGVQGAADNLMVLHPKPDTGNRILSLRGKDIEDRHLEFEVTNKGSKWNSLGVPGETQRTEVQQQIYDYLCDGPCRLKDIREACEAGDIEVSANSISTILGRMVDSGRLVKVEYGKYATSDYVERRIGKSLKNISHKGS